MRMNRILPGLILGSVLLASGALQAADCGDASVEAQQLEKSGKLLAARDKFLACSAETCGKNLSKDCRERYEAVLPRIPTVVFEAFRGETQLAEFKVSVDGVAVKVEGSGMAIDPGKHTFTFQAEDETVTEERIIVESKKGQSIRATFKAKPVPTTAEKPTEKEPTPPTADTPAATTSAVPITPAAPAESSSSSRGTFGLLLGGVGLVGMGVGVALGFSAKSMADSADCDGNRCATQSAVDQRHDAVGRAGTATLVFGVGTALAVGGLVLWITAPRSEPSQKTTAGLAVRVAPSGVTMDWRF